MCLQYQLLNCILRQNEVVVLSVLYYYCSCWSIRRGGWYQLSRLHYSSVLLPSTTLKTSSTSIADWLFMVCAAKYLWCLKGLLKTLIAGLRGEIKGQCCWCWCRCWCWCWCRCRCYHWCPRSVFWSLWAEPDSWVQLTVESSWLSSTQ